MTGVGRRTLESPGVPMLTRRLSFSNWSMLSWRTSPPSAPVASSPAATSTARWCSRTSGVANGVLWGDFPSPEKGDLGRSDGGVASRIANAAESLAPGGESRMRDATAEGSGPDASIGVAATGDACAIAPAMRMSDTRQKTQRARGCEGGVSKCAAAPELGAAAGDAATGGDDTAAAGGGAGGGEALTRWGETSASHACEAERQRMSRHIRNQGTGSKHVFQCDSQHVAAPHLPSRCAEVRHGGKRLHDVADHTLFRARIFRNQQVVEQGA